MRTKTERDNQGSHISIVRMDANLAYFGIPQLLQQVINKGDEKAWNNIRLKIDYMYNHIDKMLKILDKNTSFLKKTRDELRKGKTILFKPNLVSPANINPITHGSDLGHTACTDWSFIAALMRWFHDILPVPYSRISLAARAQKQLDGFYTGSAGQNSDPESIKRYISDVENKDSRLTFTVYVPKGYGKMGELILPNLKETENSSKIFTAEFPDEKWII